MAKVLKVCDMDMYPNIYVLLKLLPKVVSLSINDQNRLSALSLMHINLDIDIDAKIVLKIFCKRDRVLE